MDPTTYIYWGAGHLMSTSQHQGIVPMPPTLFSNSGRNVRKRKFSESVGLGGKPTTPLSRSPGISGTQLNSWTWYRITHINFSVYDLLDSHNNFFWRKCWCGNKLLIDPQKGRIQMTSNLQQNSSTSCSTANLDRIGPVRFGHGRVLKEMTDLGLQRPTAP